MLEFRNSSTPLPFFRRKISAVYQPGPQIGKRARIFFLLQPIFAPTPRTIHVVHDALTHFFALPCGRCTPGPPPEETAEGRLRPPAARGAPSSACLPRLSGVSARCSWRSGRCRSRFRSPRCDERLCGRRCRCSGFVDVTAAVQLPSPRRRLELSSIRSGHEKCALVLKRRSEDNFWEG